MAADLDGTPLAPAVSVGVVGAGTMGIGIAQVAAQAGHRVLLYDSRPDAAARAVDGLAATLDKLAARGRLTQEQANTTRSNFHATVSLSEFASCGLILEAIAEDLGAKKELLRGLESIVESQTIFASNTSSLSITAIAAGLQHPERVAGMHFFNPAPQMPLVEIIAGLASSPGSLSTLEATARAWGKQTVRARSTPGFIVNRVARPFYGEALRLLTENAASPATLDAVFREAGGFRMGPFELMDLIGLDVNFQVTRSVFEATFGDPRFTPSLLQGELVHAGRLGRKTGLGFYSYAPGASASEASTLAPSAYPESVHLFGNDPLVQVLRERLGASGKSFQLAPAHADGRLAQTPHTCIYRSDGRSATQRAHDLGQRSAALVDLAYDITRATRLAVTVADQANPAALTDTAGLLQAAGFTISVLGDAPGMALLRTVAMLANEAADAVLQGVCSVADCDKAMRLGTSYPSGPLEWADALGAALVVTVLDHIREAYGDPRYRVSPLLRRKALTGTPFHPTHAS